MDGLIYNQNHIPKEEHRYGFRASASVGCGWVATHNALRLLGYKTDIDGLIRYYESLLPLIHGNAGTSFWAPALCFQKWGFPVEIVTKRSRFDAAAKAADVCILFYRWKKKYDPLAELSGKLPHRRAGWQAMTEERIPLWKLGAHFVALQHREDGFFGYNTYRNSTGPDRYGDSLDGFLKEKGYFGCVLICIHRKPAP